MSDPSDSKQSILPPRLLRPEERVLVEEWLAAAGDISLAYVSSRSGDHPSVFRKIVIFVEGNEKPSYYVDAPGGTKHMGSSSNTTLNLMLFNLAPLVRHSISSDLYFLRPQACLSEQRGEVARDGEPKKVP